MSKGGEILLVILVATSLLLNVLNMYQERSQKVCQKDNQKTTDGIEDNFLLYPRNKQMFCRQIETLHNGDIFAHLTSKQGDYWMNEEHIEILIKNYNYTKQYQKTLLSKQITPE